MAINTLENMEILAPLLGFYAALLGALAIGGLISYIFSSIGMYALAKKQSVPYAWMAYIPYLRTYLNGELAGDIPLGKKTLKKPGLWLLFAPMVVGIIMAFVLVLYIVMIAITAAPMAATATPSAAAISTFFSGLIVWMIILIVVSLLYSVVTYGLSGIIHYSIYKKYTSDNMAALHMILGLFVPFYRAIYLFILRNRPLPDAPVAELPILPDQE